MRSRSRPGRRDFLPSALVFLGAVVVTDGAAATCPEPPSESASFASAGPIAQSGEDLVRFAGHIGEVVVHDTGVAGALVGFSPDGRLVVTAVGVRVGRDAPAPCAHTHVWVRVHDLSDRTSRRIARLAGGRPTHVRFSPTGRFVAVGVTDGEAAARVHLFDLDSGRRSWVIDGVDAIWLDEERLVVRDRVGRLSLHLRAEGERVRVLSPPARRLRPYASGADDTGFWASAGRGPDLRFVRVHLEGTRLRVEDRAPALARRPELISRDGRRGAWFETDSVEVRDLDSGELVASISGRAAYRGGALSDDGSTLVAISEGAIEIMALDESEYISWGAPEPGSEVAAPAPAPIPSPSPSPNPSP